MSNHSSRPEIHGRISLSLLLILAVLPVAPVSAAAPFVAKDTQMYYPPAVAVRQAIDEQVLAVAFSPDGKRLVTAGARHTMPGQFKIWDVENMKELVSVRGIRGVRSVAFSPDGTTVACADFGGAIRLRDAATGNVRSMMQAHGVGVNGLAYSRDGTMIASAGLDRLVKIWFLKEVREPQVLSGHTEMVYSVAFFRHGKAVVSCGKDNTARIWDLASGKEKFVLSGHDQGVEGVAISPDDKFVATASWDRTIRLWDAETGREVGVLNGSPASVFAVAFSPDGKLIAGGTADGTVLLWDLKTRSIVGKRGSHAGPVWTLAFSPDGKTLASGSSDRTAKVWNVAALKSTAFASLFHTISAAKTFDTSEFKPIRALAAPPAGNVVALATNDKKVRLRNTRTGEALVVFSGNKSEVTCLAFSLDGQILAGGADDSITLWDRSTGKEKRTWKAHAGGVHALVFLPGGRELASAGEDQMIRLWDLESGKERAVLKGNEAAVHALAVSPDGRELASGGADRIIRVWSLADSTIIRTLNGHEGTIRALAYSAMGNLASAGTDGTVRLWSRKDDSPRQIMRGHVGEIGTLTFSRGGGTLLSGGKDGRIILWEVDTGKLRSMLVAHRGPVTGLAIEPDGKSLLSGSSDATLLRWSSTKSYQVGAPPMNVMPSRITGTRAIPLDWPGWRGSAGNGIRAEPTPVLNWSADSGVKWRVPVPGEGHASPIIVGNRVIVSSADEAAQTRTLFCYHRESGALLWSTPFHMGGFMAKHNKNTHASPTPVSDGVFVFVPYIAGDSLWLSAIDLRNGAIAWQPRIGPFVPQWGYASSPCLYKDLVIVLGDNKGNAPGTAQDPTSYLAAVNRKTGAIAWRVPRINFPSYGSPVVAHLAGRDQLLLSGSERITAYDPSSGKELWFCQWSAERAANSVVWGDNRVYASVNWPSNDIVCVRADGSGDVTNSHVLWRVNRNAADVSAPLYHDGRLYVFSDKGIASCLNGATGETIWQVRLGGTFSSSPVLVGDRILMTDESGTTYVLRAGPQFNLFAKNFLNDPVLASIAPSGDKLFVRSRRFLWCLDGNPSSRPVMALPPGVRVLPSSPRPPQGLVFEPPPSRQQQDANLVPGQPVRKAPANRSYLTIVLAALLLLLLLTLGGLLLVVHVRRSSEVILDASCVIEEPEPVVVDTTITFSCSGCGKTLRGKMEMAGKKVKCPRCSTAICVPGSQSSS